MSVQIVAVNQASPVVYTSIAGTTAQVMSGAVAGNMYAGAGVTPMLLNLGGAFLSGRPFKIVLACNVKAHGTAQTGNIGLQASVFGGTLAQLALGTASGAMTAGTSYPFYMEARLIADNNSGILSGSYWTVDGVTPTFKTAATVTNFGGVNFGTGIVSPANAANPLASASTYALTFAPTFTNSVSDVAEVVNVTAFWAEIA